MIGRLGGNGWELRVRNFAAGKRTRANSISMALYHLHPNLRFDTFAVAFSEQAVLAWWNSCSYDILILQLAGLAILL